MVRTQIQLTETQAAEMKKRAARHNVSMAEEIRRALDESIARDPDNDKWERARNAVGFARSGVSDLSENHDFYLAQVYAGEASQE